MRDRLFAGLVLPFVLASFADAQFIQNKGQLPDQVRFVARQGCMTAFLSDTSFLVQVTEPPVEGQRLRGANVLFVVERANPQSQAAGCEQLPGLTNYIIGDDPKKWTTGVPSWARVSMPDVLRGVSVDFHHENGVLEYDVLLTGGASAEDLAFRVEGAEGLSIDESGALIATTAVGTIRQDLPAAYRVGQGGRRENVACRFRLLDTTHFGFELPGVPPGVDLLIDPILTFAGYLSGSNGDEAHSVAVDSAGATYVVGRTASANYPKTTGAFDVTMNGAFEGFVSKVNAAGTALVYSTYLGCAGTDLITSILVDASGQALVTGSTGSGFPTTTGVFDTSYNGWKEAFVAKLNATGSGLVFATYVGGDNEDIGNGIAVDSAGNIYVAGQTHSTNFPTTAGAYDGSENGNWDAFLVKLNPTATALLYGTHLGGAGIDWANDLAVAADNTVTVIGDSDSTAFPTTAGAFDTSPNGSLDAFVTKVNASGSGLVFSTLLGSAGIDHAMDVALDAAGLAYVTGVALPGFPTTTGAYDTTNNNGDAFVAKLNAAGSALSYCTFLGGGGTEQGSAIAVDAGGSAFVAGFTTSTNFPISAGAVQSTFSGGGGSGDGFFAKISATGGRLDYGTYFGGSGYDEVRAMAIGGPGGVVMVGSTNSPNLQVPAGNFGWPYGIDEGFMARLDLPIATTSVLGAGWSPSAPVTALAMLEPPVIGQLAIVTVMNAPPSTPGGIYVSSQASQSFVGAVPIYLNMADYVLMSSFTSTPTGGATLFYSLPASAALAGAVAHAQAVLFTPASPYGIEVSNGLMIKLGF